MTKDKDPKSRQGQGNFILLRKIKYRESDLIIHAISTQGEKLSFLARGALRSKKRFGGGVLEPTHFVSLTYKFAPSTGQLNILEEAAVINDFSGLRKNYDRLELALLFIECVSKVSQEGDQDSEFLFNLLGNSLKAAESSKELQTLKMHFYLKFLLQQGVITPEPWMGVFLKTHLKDSNKLTEITNIRQVVDEHLYNIDLMIKHYLQNAVVF